MIEIRTNTQQVIGQITEKIGLLLNSQEMMKTVAVAVLPVMKKRVHEDGKDANDNPIGTYSPGYMKVRTGIFGNSGTYKRGPNKGKPKDTGVFTKGKHKGSPRPKYNRTNDTKVVGSLTRRMENDMVVVPMENGYGIGYTNEYSMQKALWLDQTYKKPILTKITAGEVELAQQTAEDYVTEVLKQI